MAGSGWQTNELAAAKAYFEQAVSIDGLHIKAAAELQSANQAITEQRFRGHMSDGFAALDSNQFAAATNAFNRAAKIYSNHPAVAQALSQVATKQSQISVSRQMRQAAEFEAASSGSRPSNSTSHCCKPTPH